MDYSQATWWKKGKSANPGGRPALPPELKAIRALSCHEVNRLVAKYARMTVHEVRVFLDDDSRPMIDQTICKIFLECHRTGDHQKLSFLLDRAIGKPKEVVLEGEDEDSRRELQDLSTTELLSIVKNHFDRAG